MSLICNLDKGMGLGRERSDVLWDEGRGTVTAVLLRSLFSDVTVCRAGNESAKGSRWLLSVRNGSWMSANCRCWGEEFGLCPFCSS